MGIKCPYCIRDLTVCESWEKSDFLVLKNTILLKKEHKYDYQLMGLMGVCGIPKCYLPVWTLMELHIEVIEFDPGFWPNVLLKLELFLRHIIMAKVMFGLHVIYFCAVCEKPILEGEELPDDSPDNSVCCDNCALWFHFHCVQVSSTEENQEWLCQACLEDLMTENLNVIATD